MHQVGNACIALDQLQARQGGHLTADVFDFQRSAAEQQLAAQLGQRRPGRGAGRLQRGRNIDKMPAAHLARHLEVALRRVGERQLVNRPLDLEFDIADLALDDGIAHIVAHLRFKHQRQVAVHTAAVTPAQTALQIKHTGKARVRRAARFGWPHSDGITGAPANLRLALGVGIGKLKVAQLQVDFWPVKRPLRLGAQPIQRQAGFLEHAGQLQRAPADADAGLAAGVGQIKVKVGAAHARPPHGAGRRGRWHRFSRQLQTHDSALGRQLLGRVQCALPMRVNRLHQTLRRKRGQLLVRLVGQRQAAGNARQRGQIKPVGLEAGIGLTACGPAHVRQRDVAARPLHAVTGTKRQARGSQAEAVGILFTLNAPGNRLKAQWL